MLKIEGNNIYLSYGNDLNVTIPIKHADGQTDYFLQEGDVVKLTVREKPFTGIGTVPYVVMYGKIENNNGVPVWKITNEDSKLPCKTYFWDARITQANGRVCTYTEGQLIILPVETTK